MSDVPTRPNGFIWGAICAFGLNYMIDTESNQKLLTECKNRTNTVCVIIAVPAPTIPFPSTESTDFHEF